MSRTFVAATLWLLACSSSAENQATNAGMGGGEASAPATATHATAAHASSSASTSGSTATLREQLLAALRADPHNALLAQSRTTGWPAPVSQGWLVVSTDPKHSHLAGDFNGWSHTPLNQDNGFRWAVVPMQPGEGYKLTDGSSTFAADSWSRGYRYDDNGEMSLVLPHSEAHLERHFEVTDGQQLPRRIRIWIPKQPPSHVLYAHDGQNLFDPAAMFGGWKLAASLPPAMMVVAIDNTPQRMHEYTHVADNLGSGMVGGGGDGYADFVHTTVRQLVTDHYGEPAKRGLLGSSLGGLISYHIALRHKGHYHFAASLSGTMGWGSIGPHTVTMIERYASSGHSTTALYLDSGGSGPCVDSDADGIQDDHPMARDNYCENKQMQLVLQATGHILDTDLWHWHEPGAPHDETAWAARVWRPLTIFAAL